jgi:hypothetical protein
MFKIQKKIIRIIAGCRSRGSCRDLFNNLKILPLPLQYTLSLLQFVVNNRDKFKLNSDVHNIKLDKNITYTILHQIYQYITKGFTHLA